LLGRGKKTPSDQRETPIIKRAIEWELKDVADFARGSQTKPEEEDLGFNPQFANRAIDRN